MVDVLVDDLFSNIPLFFKIFFKEGFNQNPASSENRVLAILMHHGPNSMSVIGRSLDLGKSNMTAIIDKLIQEGFVERLPVESDRRIIRVSLTDEGKMIVEKRRSEIRATVREKLKSLTQEELQKLYDSAENIRIIFHKMDETKT
jgi:DNA-binding MarR family transcriptional regulator